MKIATSWGLASEPSSVIHAYDALVQSLGAPPSYLYVSCSANDPIEEIVVRGLQAGIDLFLLCRVWEALTPATEAVLAALREGTLSEERLLASWQRIMRAKSRFASFANRCTPETIDGFLAEQQEHRTQAAHLQARWTDASRPA